jgi:hypothetical protein
MGWLCESSCLQERLLGRRRIGTIREPTRTTRQRSRESHRKCFVQFSWLLSLPSYTDRVLHKTERASDVQLLCYRRVSEMVLSDHKPVFAVYKAKAREVRPADYAKT